MKNIKANLMLMGVALAVLVLQPAQAQTVLRQSVLGNGGTVVSNSAYRLNGTVGQPVIGVTSSSSQVNKIGFWYPASVIVNIPPSRVVRVADANALLGSTVDLPITLVAQGDESALGFSLAYDPAILSNPQARLGKDASAASLNTNDSQKDHGQFGIALALPTGQTFTAGTVEIVVMTFTINANTSATTARIDFGDQPLAREVVDVNATSLLTDWTFGTVTITVGTSGFEADVASRPNGNGTVTISDWVQVGRFVAGLDVVSTDVNEFQRADSAPKDCGDGLLTISDWVQAGRYASGLDPIVAACGPTNPAAAMAMKVVSAGAATRSKVVDARAVRAVDATFKRGQTDSLTIELEAQGDENALGFSLSFDQNVLTFKRARLGNEATGAALNVNSGQAANGRVGAALALPAGQKFAAGVRQIIIVIFSVSANVSATSTTIAFDDQPIAREVVDVNANALSTTWTPGLVKIEGTTSVKENVGEIPISYELGQNYPNPFNPTTWITFDIPALAGETQIRLEIFSIDGKLVRSLVNGKYAPGAHRVQWDSRDDNGAVVPTGVYFYRIRSNKFTASRKLMLVK